MIDYLCLSSDVNIHPKQLKSMKWYSSIINNTEQTYLHTHNGVRIRYYPERGKISIKGKLLMLLHNTQVQNVDDVYGADTERFITELNAYLNQLFTAPLLDIRWFKVSRIDYCFNVKTPHVQAYLDFMGKALKQLANNKRVNFTLEKNLSGSVYVRTQSDYAQNELRNYTLNFYDKTDRLLKQQADGTRISAADFEHAHNVLRLEVQCGYQFIKQLCQKLKITNSFGNLFAFQVAMIAEELIYNRVFSCGIEQDFYAYDVAKKLLPPNSNAAKKALQSASTNHNIRGESYAHGRRVAADAGVYPFCFIPKNYGINHLDNPLKLIHKKLEALGLAVHKR